MLPTNCASAKVIRLDQGQSNSTQFYLVRTKVNTFKSKKTLFDIPNYW